MYLKHMQTWYCFAKYLSGQRWTAKNRVVSDHTAEENYHEKFSLGPKPVWGDHFWLLKIVSPDWKCVHYWSICTKSGPVGNKRQAHNEMIHHDVVEGGGGDP